MALNADFSVINGTMNLTEKHAESLAWRTARIADAESIVALVNGAYRGESGRRGWTTEANLIAGQRIDPDQLAEIIHPPQSVVLLAFDPAEPEKILGCVHLKNLNGVCYLGMLTVQVDIQTRGLGSYLMRISEDFAREFFHARAVEMVVIRARQELIQWYQRRGYALTGEQRPFPYGQPRFGLPLTDDLDFVVLEKPLE